MLLETMAITGSVEARTRAVWYSDEAAAGDAHDLGST